MDEPRIPHSPKLSAHMNPNSIDEGTDLILRMFLKDNSLSPQAERNKPPSKPPQEGNDILKEQNGLVSKVAVVPSSKEIPHRTSSSLKREAFSSPISVIFNVRVETAFGEAVYVTGNAAQLGEWNPLKAVALITNSSSFPLWSTCVSLLPASVEYKYIIRKNRSEESFRWEEIESNRKVDLEIVAANDLFLYMDDGVFGKLGQSILTNSKTVQGLRNEIEECQRRISIEKDEKAAMEKEKQTFNQKLSSMDTIISQLKKQIVVLEGAKLDTLSTSDLKTLVQKSKKTAHKANVELTKRIENEIYYLQRSRDCAVCMDRPIDTVCLPCGHLALCTECATKLYSRCVICNVKIQRIQKVLVK